MYGWLGCGCCLLVCMYLPYLTCRPNNEPKRGARVEGEAAAKGVGCGRGGLRMGCGKAECLCAEFRQAWYHTSKWL